MQGENVQIYIVFEEFVVFLRIILLVMGQDENMILIPTAKNKGEIVLYQPNDQLSLEVKLENETVWLTQQQMAVLFDVKENNITYHIQSVFKTHELDPEATTQKIRVVRKEGNRQVSRNIDFYNLDMIISVGYRVNSANATQFRRWATSILKEYMLKGYAVNQRLIAMEERIDRRLAQHENVLQEHQEKIDFFVRTNLPPVEQVFFECFSRESFSKPECCLKNSSKAHNNELLSSMLTLMPLLLSCLMCAIKVFLLTSILVKT